MLSINHQRAYSTLNMQTFTFAVTLHKAEDLKQHHVKIYEEGTEKKNPAGKQVKGKLQCCGRTDSGTDDREMERDDQSG